MWGQIAAAEVQDCVVPQRAHPRNGGGDGGDEGAGSKDGFSKSVSHRQQPARGLKHSTQTVAHGASNGMMRGSREWWQRLRVPKGICLVTGQWPLWTRS